jgi:pilus assembly protein Flp/PilA
LWSWRSPGLSDQNQKTYLRIMLAARLDRDDERGASAVEYGLLIAGIAALIVAVVFIFGETIQGVFTDTCTAVNNDVACD